MSAWCRSSLPSEQFHARADIDVHGRDVHAAADAAFHQRLVLRNIRTVPVVDVRASLGNDGNRDAGHVTEQFIEHAAHDAACVPKTPPGRRGKCGLHVREFAAIVTWQWFERTPSPTSALRVLRSPIGPPTRSETASR